MALRIETERLVVRPLAHEDIDEFVRYRNIESISRYQDWTLPYTKELAVELVDEVQDLGVPTPDNWLQLGVLRDGVLLGDLAVWLDDTGSFAMIGYTLAPEHQGSGYAVEAVGAIVDWLFETAGVHRIVATIDPRNRPSARVLERTGFEYVGTARSAALVRGEWLDDTRYSLLADDRRAWLDRVRTPPERVELVEVTPGNVRAVGKLEVAPSQRRLVSSVLQSIADAAHPEDHEGHPVVPWYRAIAADGELVGFVMVARRSEHHPVSYLWRFLIDRRHQRRDIGRRAIGVLVRLLADEGEDRLELSFVDEPGGPEPFYAALGFDRTGAIEDGEVVAAADLATIIERTAD
jgi:RimJ/RimL family protein N-acetyltransferase